MITVDSFHYYGTSDTYLGYFARFLKPGAQIGMAVPGLVKEIEGVLPAYLTAKDEAGNCFWDPKECWSFHTADWWRNHWEHTGIVDIEHAAAVENGWSIWLKFDDVVVAAGEPMPLLGAPSLDTGAALRADRGEYLGLIEVIARVRE